MKATFWALCGALIGLAAFLFSVSQPAHALADPLNKIRSYQISCGTSATRMGPSDVPMEFHAMKFWVNSATSVYVGGSDVDTSTKGMPYCTNTSNCVAAMESVDGFPREVYCRVASGTVTVTVLAGRK